MHIFWIYPSYFMRLVIVLESKPIKRSSVFSTVIAFAIITEECLQEIFLKSKSFCSELNSKYQQ